MAFVMLDILIFGKTPEKPIDYYPESTRSNLRWFFLNGFFASASDAISLNYLTLFILSLGASSGEIGLMTALASLSATIMLLPGAALAEKWGNRKRLVLITGGGIGRFTLLLLAITPFFFGFSDAIIIAIILKIIADGIGQFSVPAWTSLTADIVPLNLRGRYFSSRNVVMSISNISVTFLAGQLITLLDAPFGYQVAMAISFTFGLVSSFYYSRIKEPESQVFISTSNHYSLGSLISLFKSDKNFSRFCIYTIFWNIFVNVAAPFFSVYMVQGLGATAAVVGALTTVSNISSVFGHRIFGQWLDRWGARRTLLISGFLIPVAVFAWLFVTEPWQITPLNFLGGLAWAGYGLASFNFLLNIAPPNQLVRYSALFQIAVMLAGSIGSTIGGMIVTGSSILTAIFISGAGRVLSMLFFARYVQDPAPLPQLSENP